MARRGTAPAASGSNPWSGDGGAGRGCPPRSVPACGWHGGWAGGGVAPHPGRGGRARVGDIRTLLHAHLGIYSGRRDGELAGARLGHRGGARIGVGAHRPEVRAGVVGKAPRSRLRLGYVERLSRGHSGDRVGVGGDLCDRSGDDRGRVVRIRPEVGAAPVRELRCGGGPRLARCPRDSPLAGPRPLRRARVRDGSDRKDHERLGTPRASEGDAVSPCTGILAGRHRQPERDVSEGWLPSVNARKKPRGRARYRRKTAGLAGFRDSNAHARCCVACF